MSKALKPVEFAAEMRRRAALLERELVKAEAETLKEARNIAQTDYSSGPYSTAQLVRMGHPYSRRRPRPPQDPGIINRQTGRFISSWRIDAPRRTGGRIVSRLRNTAPYAKDVTEGIVNGRWLAIRRPIAKRILRDVRQARVERLKGVLIRVLGARSR